MKCAGNRGDGCGTPRLTAEGRRLSALFGLSALDYRARIDCVCHGSRGIYPSISPSWASWPVPWPHSRHVCVVFLHVPVNRENCSKPRRGQETKTLGRRDHHCQAGKQAFDTSLAVWAKRLGLLGFPVAGSWVLGKFCTLSIADGTPPAEPSSPPFWMEASGSGPVPTANSPANKRDATRHRGRRHHPESTGSWSRPRKDEQEFGNPHTR